MGQGSGWKSGGAPTSRNKNKSAGMSSKAGGGGSSAGSSGAGNKGNASAGTGSIQTGGGNGSGGGSSSTTINQQVPSQDLAITFGPGLTADQKEAERVRFEKMPQRLREILRERGLRVNVGKRADQTPGWAETGYNSSQQIADGRQMGSLSFYTGTTNQVFISVDSKSGSVNVHTHEMGHAVDMTWITEADDPSTAGRAVMVEWPPDSGNEYRATKISEDPEWKEIHTSLLDEPDLRDYYKYGPNTKPDSGPVPEKFLVAGRAELFAEGFAVYNEGGLLELTGFVHSLNKAQQLVNIWKRYGVIE